MERVLITGATGTVGNLLARRLAEDGAQVRALVRSPERAARALPTTVEIAAGDITDAASVQMAVKGCDTIFHTAGLPEQWLADPDVFERVNRDGTRHIVEAALAEGVTCFVHTSTIDVFEKSPGRPFDETRLEQRPLASRYQRSKQAADRLVTEALAHGLPARFVHPSAVYGPGPASPTGTNGLLVKLARNQVPVLPPGGMPLVLTEDLTAGQLLAAQAPVGSRWILSDRYLTMREIAEHVHALVPRAKIPGVLPSPVATVLATAGEAMARVTHHPPMLASGELSFLRSHSLPDAHHARQDLGWTNTPPAEGFERTLKHFGELPR